jgi:hypothetical protein
MVSDYQTNPIIEGSVYLGEEPANDILGKNKDVKSLVNIYEALMLVFSFMVFLTQ